MPYFLISAMTVLATISFVWLIASSQHSNLYSLRNLFLACWMYYGFSVGIDLMTGAEIPYTPGEVYMMDPATWGSVAFVMWNYVLLGFAFVVTYLIMQGSQPSRPLALRYKLSTPPEWAIILLHLLAGYFYAQIFLGMDRMERIAMAQRYTSYKFATLIVPLMLAVDIILILNSKDRKSILTSVMALLIALLTGNRNYVLFVFLVTAFHWRPAMRGWKLAGMVGSCGFVVFAFKTVYAVGLAWMVGERVDGQMIYENLQLSLSGLDADASYVIAAFYTSHESPMWLGQSYIETPILLAWPRFLGGVEVSTLAEEYVWAYHTRTAERGGALAFSAIAEAWLNFGYAGALVLGTFWGIVTNLFDRRPRGILFFIVLLMVARLFRSDAASLVKNWLLVWGTMFVIAMAALSLYTALVAPRHTKATGQQAAHQRPQLSGTLP